MQVILNSKICLLTATAVKNAASTSWVLKFILLLLAYLEPLKNMYHFVVAVIAVNWVVGFYKSKKVNKERFSTAKCWRTIEKLGLFTTYMVFIYVFETMILTSSDLYVSRFICGMLILSEAKSISENGDAILHTRLFVPFYKKITLIFAKKNGKE